MNYSQDLYTGSGEQHTLNCLGTVVDLRTPVIMGILNITPDSFYDGGKFTEESRIINQAGRMLSDGASFIDIGGQSTRPGATLVTPEEEISRVVPAIRALVSNFEGILISVDTFYSAVAEAAISAGAVMVNDISAGGLDPKIIDVVAEHRCPYVLMHMKGEPANMQQQPVYDDVTEEVMTFLKDKLIQLKSKGIEDVIIDPGFGFGKETAHNFTLLHDLGQFRMLGKPLLAGISRKSMICKTLGVDPAGALHGSGALHMVALLNGASVLRVHDVKEASQVLKLYQSLTN